MPWLALNGLQRRVRGLWWHCGHTPQYFAGNGFTAQGFDHSSYCFLDPTPFSSGE